MKFPQKNLRLQVLLERNQMNFIIILEVKILIFFMKIIKLVIMNLMIL